MTTIRSEIDKRYDPKSGFHTYAPNRGRMSIGEVLRRAGGVDKNTLKAPYHAKVRKEVLAFVTTQRARLFAHDRSDARKRAAEAKSDSELVDWYAQIAKAADVRADRAEAKARRLSKQLEESVAARLAALEQVEALTIQVSEGRVVRLRPGDPL
jgi:hypothetical protein